MKQLNVFILILIIIKKKQRRLRSDFQLMLAMIYKESYPSVALTSLQSFIYAVAIDK